MPVAGGLGPLHLTRRDRPRSDRGHPARAPRPGRVRRPGCAFAVSPAPAPGSTAFGVERFTGFSNPIWATAPGVLSGAPRGLLRVRARTRPAHSENALEE